MGIWKKLQLFAVGGCAPERCRWQKKRGGKQVPRSITDEGVSSPRKISGTANGWRLIRSMQLFAVGGCSYMTLELLWRGWSHGSMFLAGGSCFLLLGRLNRTQPRLPLLPRGAMGALVITSVELLAGLLANRDYSVWDYRHLPGNFHGQICLPFTLLWMPISVAAMALYELVDQRLPCAYKS